MKQLVLAGLLSIFSLQALAHTPPGEQFAKRSEHTQATPRPLEALADAVRTVRAT